jgi:monolysocardiolipin acyltransferase
MDSLLEPEERILREQYLTAPWGELGRSATLAFVSLVGKFILTVLNSTEIDGLERLHDHVLNRPQGAPLITVSNHTRYVHVLRDQFLTQKTTRWMLCNSFRSYFRLLLPLPSTLDDPMLLSAMLPWTFFLTEHVHGRTRWSLCARELCYRNHLLGQFFRSGKTLPVDRGAGLTQPVMRAVAGELSRGSWVHIFPEGRIHYTGTLGPLRWGVGKLFCDAVEKLGHHAAPTVLPFYHSGMGDVMPRGGRIPRGKREIHVAVGTPVELNDLAVRCGVGDEQAQRCVWKEIGERIGEALRALEKQLPPNPAQETVVGGEARTEKRRIFQKTAKPATEEAALPR